MDIREYFCTMLHNAMQSATSSKRATIVLYGGQIFTGIIDDVNDVAVTLKLHDLEYTTVHIVDTHLIVAVTLHA